MQSFAQWKALFFNNIVKYVTLTWAFEITIHMFKFKKTKVQQVECNELIISTILKLYHSVYASFKHIHTFVVIKTKTGITVETTVLKHL